MGAFTFEPAQILACVIFGAIGTGAFFYGKKQASWPTMLIGIGLMLYPYFVTGTWALYGIGIFLTAALFFWRE